jgi:hypothetical protein
MFRTEHVVKPVKMRPWLIVSSETTSKYMITYGRNEDHRSWLKMIIVAVGGWISAAKRAKLIVTKLF